MGHLQWKQYLYWEQHGRLGYEWKWNELLSAEPIRSICQEQCDHGRFADRLVHWSSWKHWLEHHMQCLWIIDTEPKS
jgi:hypothetical protein